MANENYMRGGSRKKTLSIVTGVPLKGGAITSVHKGLLSPGQFSMVQNLRGTGPGFEKRLGYVKQHSTADSTNEVVSLFHYNRDKANEEWLLAQMGDGDVLEATTMPPGITTGAFGSELWSGTTAPNPASWSNLSDKLIYSNGVDQHQIWTGKTNDIGGFVVYKGTTNPSTLKGVLEDFGEDYSSEVIDGETTTVAILDSLDTAANGDGFFVYTETPMKSLTLTVSAANGSAATLAGYYWKTDSTWSALTIGADGTASGGATLAITGTITITEPTDIQDKYLFGKVGYWYLFVVSAALDAEVEISGATYDSNFYSIKSLWDGASIFAVETQVEGTTQWETYSAASVDVGSLTNGKKIVMGFTDPQEALYIDVGEIPNATGTAITSLKYWNGVAWASVGTPVDGTAGLSSSGWICYPRPSDEQPRQFETSRFYAYWYELILDTTLSADMTIGVEGQPYFDITDMGNVGQCSSAWKNRVVYSFADKYPEYVYIAANGNPQVLAAGDTGIIELGDGRAHKVAAMKNFYNEIMVWQEEKGSVGGTLTLIQGYNQATFGKVVLSTRLGTMNSKSVDIVENFTMRTASDETIKKAAFCLSREGVYMCDGKSIAFIDGAINNYFDPADDACIRRGYEDKMWLKYDPSKRCVRLGLVSGSSATACNVWPVFDVTEGVWYFDDFADPMNCLENVGAPTGNIPVVQVSGGTADGTIYNMNTGTNDISTAINSYIDIELHSGGEWILLEWLSLTCKVQAAGDITMITYENGVQKDSVTVSMTAEITNNIIRRNLQSLNVQSPHITVRLQHNTVSQECDLHHLGLEIYAWNRK